MNAAWLLPRLDESILAKAFRGESTRDLKDEPVISGQHVDVLHGLIPEAAGR